MSFSDHFDDGSIGAGWRIVNLSGRPNTWVEAGSVVTGSVVSGNTHDLFGTNHRALRLVQSHDDSDFTVTLQLTDTSFTGSFKLNGFIFQEADDKYIRVDAYSSGSNRFWFAHYNDNGSQNTKFNTAVSGNIVSPYLRVERVGTQFNVFESADGITFNSIGSFFQSGIAINEIGLTVGNASGGSSPAHSQSFEFIEFASDPFPSGSSVESGVEGSGKFGSSPLADKIARSGHVGSGLMGSNPSIVAAATLDVHSGAKGAGIISSSPVIVLNPQSGIKGTGSIGSSPVIVQNVQSGLRATGAIGSSPKVVLKVESGFVGAGKKGSNIQSIPPGTVSVNSGHVGTGKMGSHLAIVAAPTPVPSGLNGTGTIGSSPKVVLAVHSGLKGSGIVSSALQSIPAGTVPVTSGLAGTGKMGAYVEVITTHQAPSGYRGSGSIGSAPVIIGVEQSNSGIIGSGKIGSSPRIKQDNLVFSGVIGSGIMRADHTPVSAYKSEIGARHTYKTEIGRVN